MFRRSLGFKIIVLVGIVLIVAFAIFTYAILKVQEEQMLAKSRRMAELVAYAIHTGLTEAMLEGETSKVQRTVEAYGPMEGIYYITIFDPDNGTILVDASTANIGNIIDQRYRSLFVSSTSNSASSPSFVS